MVFHQDCASCVSDVKMLLWSGEEELLLILFGWEYLCYRTKKLVPSKQLQWFLEGSAGGYFAPWMNSRNDLLKKETFCKKSTVNHNKIWWIGKASVNDTIKIFHTFYHNIEICKNLLPLEDLSDEHIFLNSNSNFGFLVSIQAKWLFCRTRYP